MICWLLCVLTANEYVGLDDFVEVTKKYAQGIIPPLVIEGVSTDDDDDDDEALEKNPDNLPLNRKVCCAASHTTCYHNRLGSCHLPQLSLCI